MTIQVSWVAGRPGRGPGVLDEDLAVQVGDGDLVAGGDDQDPLEPASSVDLVVDLVQHESPGAGQLLDLGVAGQREPEVSPPRTPVVSPMS